MMSNRVLSCAVVAGLAALPSLAQVTAERPTDRQRSQYLNDLKEMNTADPTLEQDLVSGKSFDPKRIRDQAERAKTSVNSRISYYDRLAGDTAALSNTLATLQSGAEAEKQLLRRKDEYVRIEAENKAEVERLQALLNDASARGASAELTDIRALLKAAETARESTAKARRAYQSLLANLSVGGDAVKAQGANLAGVAESQRRENEAFAAIVKSLKAEGPLWAAYYQDLMEYNDKRNQKQGGKR